MAAQLEELIGEVAPQWRPRDPPGGFIAAELKKIHDDSMSIFPESVYSMEGGRRRARWKSTMHSDFIPIERLRERAEKKQQKLLKVSECSADNDCGVSGALGSGADSMFQKWKIPSRLTEKACSETASSAATRELEAQMEDMNIQAPALPEICGASPRSSLAIRSHPAVPRDRLRASFPNGQQPKSLKTKTLMDRFQPRDERGTAARWLAQASDDDKKRVEKAIKMAVSKKDDVRQPVKAWLQGASPKERQVALTFFQSLTGTQLMGGTEKKERVDQVIKLLKNPPNKYETASAPVNRRTAGVPRQFRLLTPGTRSRKWQHQTWHHLPSYANQDPVYNKSAILIEPHATVHRHFTIHPDWGP